MKILFVWDWPPVITQVATWEDGLAAAVKELSTRHEVLVCMPDTHSYLIRHPYFDIVVSDDLVEIATTFGPDVILHWADMTRANAKPLSKLGIPMAICFAGGDIDGPNTPLFQHIFVESGVYLDKAQNTGWSTSMAFGTNTDLFTPIPEQAKVFDALMVGTFALWKRHDLFAKATKGLIACAVGYMYKDSYEAGCYEVCEAAGNLVLPHLSHQAVARLMAASRCVIVPSNSMGGSQRTVLEAMAMNIPLIVTDSDKYDFAAEKFFRAEPTAEGIKGYLAAILDGEYEANTRDFVLQNWSHICYADALEEGLQAII